MTLTSEGSYFLSLADEWPKSPQEAELFCNESKIARTLWTKLIECKLINIHPRNELYEESYSVSDVYVAVENELLRAAGKPTSEDVRTMHSDGRSLVKLFINSLNLLKPLVPAP